MNGTTDRAMESPRKAPPAQLRSVSWNEDVGDSELDVPGTPRTPRTSTTPGKQLTFSYTTSIPPQEVITRRN